MASLYPKKISGKTYWYLREMARVGGRPKPGRAAVEPGHLPGAGGAEQGGGPLLQAGVGGLVEANRRRPVHQDPRRRARSPAVLGRDARRVAEGPGAGQPGDRL